MDIGLHPQNRRRTVEQRTIMASTFKQQCLALLDQVARTKVPIIITKHGQPIAQLTALENPSVQPTIGSVQLLAADDTAYYSVGEPWEADGSPSA